MLRTESRRKTDGARTFLDVTSALWVWPTITWLKQPFVQRLLLLLGLVLLAMSFGVWFLRSSHTSFARSTSFETCSTVALKDRPQFCTGADPIAGGCSQDARTFLPQQEVLFDGQAVGMAQMRYSPSCNTYWVRGFSYLPNTSVSVYVENLGASTQASYLSSTPEAYSNMVYATPPTVVVQIDVSSSQTARATIVGVK